MSTTVDAPPTPSGEPPWCSSHYEPSCGEAFHQFDFRRTWGSFDEKLRLGLIRFDSDGLAGDSRVEVQYVTGDQAEGSVGLDDNGAREFTGAILCALATKERASSNPLTLILRCGYEAGRAFMAAVRSSRADSPRTASSHSRSMIST